MPDKNSPRTLRLNAKDNVIVAVDTVMPDVTVQGVTAANRIMRGHKMASACIAKGQPICSQSVSKLSNSVPTLGLFTLGI